MKSILLTAQPKWCELIASGKKTIDVRKTAPKLETPVKCYIYQSHGKKRDYFSRQIQEYFNQGKVIGEFVCDRIDKYTSEFWNDTPDYMDKNHAMEQIRKSYFADPDDWECEEEFEYITGNEVENPDDCELCKQSCLTYAEIRNYVGVGDKTFYGWHISNLKIYDKPKELREFKSQCKKYFRENPDCVDCKYESDDVAVDCKCGGLIPLTTPPQSWRYVES